MKDVRHLAHARSIVVSACSEAFFDYYLDLVETLCAVGLRNEFSLGLLDLGLNEQQIEIADAHGIERVVPQWPIQPPAHQASLEYFGFAAKAYLREFFPGYAMYVWMDADMWVQTPDFWEHLYPSAMRGLIAVPRESDSGYQRATMTFRAWMLANYRRGLGIPAAIRLSFAPIINNAIAAIRGDAPHWDVWQREYERMVQRSDRLPGIDQLALSSVIFRHRLPAALMPATDNWICSRGTPWWDPYGDRFVAGGDVMRPISVIHLTGPSRDRRHEVRTTDGRVVRKFLHRPDGHVARRLDSRSVKLPAGTFEAGPTQRLSALTR